ncbi:alpha-1,2-fucosyltransferase [Priestia aryabhattai]
MKIVQISSGLGNQMFQYALYKKMLIMGKDVYVDTLTSYELGKNQHNGYELEKVFKVNPRHANKADLNKLGDLQTNLLSRIRRKLLGLKNSMYIETTEFKFNDEIFNELDVYLKGYWQNYKYVEDIKESLIQDFTFVEKLDVMNKNIADNMKQQDSVSIHVRRGDYYANKTYAQKFGDIANIGYYNKAISIIKNQITNPQFYIFSDDINWAKQNLDLNGCATYISHNTKENSYKDMQLMSLCKHNIIANSTFSWWGAFLNANSTKIVIAPNKWINTPESGNINIFPRDWMTI